MRAKIGPGHLPPKQARTPRWAWRVAMMFQKSPCCIKMVQFLMNLYFAHNYFLFLLSFSPQIDKSSFFLQMTMRKPSSCPRCLWSICPWKWNPSLQIIRSYKHKFFCTSQYAWRMFMMSLKKLPNLKVKLAQVRKNHFWSTNVSYACLWYIFSSVHRCFGHWVHNI